MRRRNDGDPPARQEDDKGYLTTTSKRLFMGAMSLGPEMSEASWLVAGMVPGVDRQPLKKLKPDEDQLMKLMNRWRYEALRAGHAIERMVVAYEAGRDGFWCAPRRRVSLVEGGSTRKVVD